MDAKQDFDGKMDTEEDAELNNCSTAELIAKIRKLKLHVKQLRHVIHKSSQGGSQDSLGQEDEPRKKKPRKERAFNFDLHPKRHVALKVTYLGWDLHGLASQEDSENTVEAHIFNALFRTKLIQARETANYQRCGRTDKGVSAFSQVLSLDLRCKARSGIGVIPPLINEASNGDIATIDSGDEDEINYASLLNKVLPKEIRVLAWAPVPTNFSARYDCLYRTYKYYFPAKQLNTKGMLDAARFLVGVHDFRNFCKLDRSGLKSTIREILEVDLEEVEGGDGELLAFRIKARSFVWHQIRCIVAVLLLVGKGLEEPSIVPSLLDIQKHPKKPQYSMAVDFPLVLFDVGHGDISWISDTETLEKVQRDFLPIILQHRIKAAMIREMLVGMTTSTEDDSAVDSLLMGQNSRIYKPLASRSVCQRIPVDSIQHNPLSEAKLSSTSPEVIVKE